MSSGGGSTTISTMPRIGGGDPSDAIYPLLSERVYQAGIGSYSRYTQFDAMFYYARWLDRMNDLIADEDGVGLTSPYSTLLAKLDKDREGITESAQPYDPSDAVTAMSEVLASLNTDITAMEPESSLESYLDSSFTKANEKIDVYDPDSDLYPESNVTEGILAKASGEATRAASEIVTAALGELEDSTDTGIVDKAIAKAATISSAIITQAITQAEDVLNSSPIQEVSEAFEDRAKRRYYKSVNRFTGRLSMINATNSSAFIIGLVLLDRELSQEVAEFESNLSYNLYIKTVDLYSSLYQAVKDNYERLAQTLTANQLNLYQSVVNGNLQANLQSNLQSQALKQNLALNAAQSMAVMFTQQNQYKTEHSRLKLEQERIGIVANDDFYRQTMNLKVKDSLFSADLIQKGINVLAGGYGGTTTTKDLPLSEAQSALGGAVGGAAFMASVTGGGTNPISWGAIGLGAAIGGAAEALM